MERFYGLTLEQITLRYRENEFLLMQHLMDIGLVDSTAPACHGDMELCEHEAWFWRCTNSRCQRKKSVVTPGTFLFRRRKFYSVFKAVYIWVSEFPAKQIGKEAGLNKDTIRKLLRDCQQVLEQGTCMLPNPVHVA